MSPPLTVAVPLSCPSERDYVLSVVFDEFLGVPVRVVREQRDDVCLSAGDGRRLTLCDRFFQTAERHWLTAESLPLRPLERWHAAGSPAASVLSESELPVLFGSCAAGGDRWIEFDEPAIRCGIDLLGSVFFLLTRYEETVTPARDAQDRFPASASLAVHENFLHRPLADEYVELLWMLLNRLWPGLERKESRYRVFLSHDVDKPFCIAGRRPSGILRDIAADVVRRGDLRFAWRQLLAGLRVSCGNLAADPFNSFDLIMSHSERRGLRSAFYFITEQKAGRIDGSHRFASPLMERLLLDVHRRGHDVGLHPSYTTFRDPEQTAREFRLLREQCDRLGVRQDEWGGRQHFLRWTNPQTWQNWADAGLDYDSTVGFADRAGFRCGTCREFPVYNLHARQPLTLRERPLIVMECTLTRYMNLTWDEALAEIERLSAQCRRYRGDFTLLWHNSMLARDDEIRSYGEALDAVA